MEAGGRLLLMRGHTMNVDPFGVSDYQREQFCRRWFIGPRCDDDLMPIYDELFEDSAPLLNSYLRYGLEPRFT